MTIIKRLLNGPKLRQAVSLLMAEARRADDEQRRHGRVPCFRPLMIQLKDSPELYSAFARDISMEGIGLLHWMPVRPEPVSVICKLEDGTRLCLSVKIDWCQPCGVGWYTSGGRFLEAEHSHP
jgi:hypothetical protein